VVCVWTTIAVERPTIAHHANLVHVQVANNQFGLEWVANVANELALWVNEVALAVEVVRAIVLFNANAIACAAVIPVGNRSSRLLDLPDVSGQTTALCRWVEHNFCAIQTK